MAKLVEEDGDGDHGDADEAEGARGPVHAEVVVHVGGEEREPGAEEAPDEGVAADGAVGDGGVDVDEDRLFFFFDGLVGGEMGAGTPVRRTRLGTEAGGGGAGPLAWSDATPLTSSSSSSSDASSADSKCSADCISCAKYCAN